MRATFNRLIEAIFFSGLVFNQSWEDPAIDEAALQVVPEHDTVLTITSGGCNSLNLLCLSPKRMICIDSNPVQSHLLALKLAGIQRLDFEEFSGFFGGWAPERTRPLTYSKVRQALPTNAQRFWDRHRGLLQKGILRQGKLGLYLRILRRYLRLRLPERMIQDFFSTETLEEQVAFYETHLSHRIWRDPLFKVVNSRLLLYLAGMHPQQHALVRQNGGLERYVRQRVEFLLTEILLQDNYFVAQAALGRYLDRYQVPPYLKEENYAVLQRNVTRVTNLTAPLELYLDSQPPGSIDKFCLLDIFDWMDEVTFKRSLASILRAASPNGRFIYRSLISSLPAPAEFAPVAIAESDLARALLARDRSGVYTSLYIYRINTAAPRYRIDTRASS